MSNYGYTIRTNQKTRKGLIAIGRLTPDVKAAMKSGFEELGANLVRTAENQALGLVAQGRYYPRKGGKTHRASAPGQSPAIDITGNYFDSFDYVARGSQELVFGNTADYAGFLEDGTETMKPRPGVINSVNASVRNIRTYLDNGIKKALDI